MHEKSWPRNSTSQGRLHHPSMAGPPLNSNLIVPSGLIHNRSSVISHTLDRNGVLTGPRNSQLMLTLDQDGYRTK